MTTLAERCNAVGLTGAQLINTTKTSRETLTNWLNHKPELFEVVLKGALPDLPVLTEQVEQVEFQQQWCFSQEDLQEQAKLIERLTEENQRLTAELSLKEKSAKKQDVIRSPYGDEEVKFYDYIALKGDYQNLKAKFDALQTNQPQNTPLNLESLDKIQLLTLLKQLETRQRPTVYRHLQNRSGCECLNSKGEPCKNPSEEVITQELRVDVCKSHFLKHKHLDY